MSAAYSNPISLLHKYAVVEFEDVQEVVLITDYDKANECLKVKINPGSEYEVYTEMYMEDQPEYWYIVETFG
jgi:hypothetical protein